MPSPTLKGILHYTASVAAAAGAAFLWHLLAARGSRFFAALRLAPAAIPFWIFTPIFAVFFLTAAIAATMLWRKNGFLQAKKILWRIYALAPLCLAWPALLFLLGSTELALVNSLTLLCLSLAALLPLFRLHKRAFFVLLFCPLWLLALTAMQGMIVWLN